MSNQSVVLLGHNFTSILGLARALGSDGYEVSAIRTGFPSNTGFLKRLGRTPEAKSKYITKYMTADSTDQEKIKDLLISEFASSERKAVLIPVDDINAQTIDLNLEDLSPWFFLPNVDHTSGGVVKLMDKFYQKQLARMAGLPVPDGWSVNIENGQYEIPAGVRFPCFVKAEMPMPKRKNYMGKCDNPDQLKALLDQAAAYRDCLMLIEEYIPIEKEYGSVGLSNRGSVCIPGITEKTRVGSGTQAGVTACGRIHLPEEYPDTCSKMKKMMALTGLHGLFDIDLYESNGILYFNELNVRFGAEGVGTLIAGVNLPGMFASSLLSPDTEIDYDAVALPLTFANERPLISDFAEGSLTWRQYRKCLKDADHRFVYSEDDRKPAQAFSLYVLRQIVHKFKR